MTTTTSDPLELVTPNPRKTCPTLGFGRPHFWCTGAFLHNGEMVLTDDYVKCGNCGQIEYEGDDS